jgi:cytochrome c oxidase subunit III
MIEQAAAPDPTEKTVKARRNITFLLVFAIVMFFAALTSAYVVSRGSTDYWSHFTIPSAFYISTAIIAVSSVFMQMALVNARKGKTKAIAPMLGITLLLGVGFSWFQFKGWGELIDRKLYVVSKIMLTQGEYGKDFWITRKGVTLERVGDQYYMPDDVQHQKPLNAELEEYKNTASSYFYVMTFAHWAHLAVGLVVLLVLLIRAAQGRYGATEHTGIWQGALYWHFLGGLWIYLLLFLSFVH